MPPIQIGSGQNSQLKPGPTIRVGGKTISGNRDVDVAIIFDTTGSMSDKIEALIRTSVNFVDEPAKHNLNPNFLLVSFGDIDDWPQTDKIEVVVVPTADIQTIKSGLQNIPRNYGGGNNGESSFEAIDLALKQQYRPNAVKVMILITDEPALFSRFKPETVQGMIAQKEMLFYAVTPNLSYFKEMATKNGGEWLEISASTSLASLTDLFKRLATNVATVSNDVYRLAGGNVKKFIQLTSGK